jgi:hypothetical protein
MSRYQAACGVDLDQLDAPRVIRRVHDLDLGLERFLVEIFIAPAHGGRRRGNALAL